MANSLNTITVNGVTYTQEDYAAMQAAQNSRTANSSLDKDAFLQLLVTQMQYQDPLDPQDNSEFVAQLAQFSALEQMTNVYESLGQLASVVANIDTSVLVGQLSGMIGQEIEWMTETVATDSNGNALTDGSGSVITTQETFKGRVVGVSLTDGVPTVIVESDGKVYRVSIGDIVHIGAWAPGTTPGDTTTPSEPTEPTE